LSKVDADGDLKQSG